jgi:hypothetical protein
LGSADANLDVDAVVDVDVPGFDGLASGFLA